MGFRENRMQGVPLACLQECIMRRERILKIVLMLVGLLFAAMIYPLMMFVRQEPALAMMLSVYVTVGIFLLPASRNPISESEPDRVHGMVELRPCNAYGGAGFR
jgi:hypothetical protein